MHEKFTPSLKNISISIIHEKEKKENLPIISTLPIPPSTFISAKSHD